MHCAFLLLCVACNVVLCSTLRAGAELENDMGDEAPESDDSDDEGEKPIYNPKKVPLDVRFLVLIYLA